MLCVACRTDTGRGWCQAKIVNIVAAPRTHALSYDVCFEGRRVDVPPKAVFRFSLTDSWSLMPVHEGSEPRYEVRDEEKERAEERAMEQAKGKSNGAAAKSKPVPADFKVRQLVDVQVGSRWFLGQVTSNAFQLLGETFEDVVTVSLLDFHADCARKYKKSSLHHLSPVAYSHPITHYPLSSLPSIRDREFDIAAIYSSPRPGFTWAQDVGGGVLVPDDDDDEGYKPPAANSDDIKIVGEEEEEEERKASSASPAAAAASSSAAAAAASPRPSRVAAAAAAPSSSSSAAAAAAPAAASPAAPFAGLKATRPLGSLSVDVFTDVHWNPPAAALNKAGNPIWLGMEHEEHLLERSFVLAQDDPLNKGASRSEESSLNKLKLMMQFCSGVSFVRASLDARPLQLGLVPPAPDDDDEDDDAPRPKAAPPAVLAKFKSVAKNTAAQRTLEAKYRTAIQAQLESDKMRGLSRGESKGVRIGQHVARLREIAKAKAEAKKRMIARGFTADDIGEADLDEAVPEQQLKVSPRACTPAWRMPAPASCSAFGLHLTTFFLCFLVRCAGGEAQENAHCAQALPVHAVVLVVLVGLGHQTHTGRRHRRSCRRWRHDHTHFTVVIRIQGRCDDGQHGARMGGR